MTRAVVIWVVEIKNTHEIIGSISVMTALEKHSTCELGYCYGSKYWGNGYATEALRAVIEYLLKECDFYLVEARHISGKSCKRQSYGKSRNA